MSHLVAQGFCICLHWSQGGEKFVLYSIQDFDWLLEPHLHFLLDCGLSMRINQLTGNYVGQCVAECEELGV